MNAVLPVTQVIPAHVIVTACAGPKGTLRAAEKVQRGIAAKASPKVETMS